MKTDKNNTGEIDVAYVANLARLHLSDEELARFQEQLNDVVGYVDKIRELDLDGVEPTSHALAVKNVFRKDEVAGGLTREEILANAPAQAEGQFKVPKIIE
ncbi:MAG: Asp-tRNA(Asn)/Glu-tRNA(Gln) amidotransferase subunit GatC [Kiritimatiellia bacterium]